MKKEDSRYLRYIVNFWTIVTFAVIILNVAKANSLTGILGPVLAVYTGALVLYSAEKEFERWKFYFIGRHPGELYVAIWTLLIFGIFAWSYITGNGYKMEPEVISAYIVVLGILAITKKSKMFYKELREMKPSGSEAQLP